MPVLLMLAGMQRRIVLGDQTSPQFGKKYSRKGAKLAKQDHIMGFHNQDAMISFPSCGSA
jgi:hypothetical protein